MQQILICRFLAREYYYNFIEGILGQYVCNAYKYWSETLGTLETFEQREILSHLSYVCPSVRGNHDCVRTQRATDFKLSNRLILKMGYISTHDLVPPT